MKITKIFSGAVLAAGLLFAPDVAAQTVTYGAYSGSEELATWGTKKKENYDIAIRVKDAGLVGKTITGVRIPFASKVDTTVVTNGRAFITKNLTVTSGKNVADVEEQSFKIAPDMVEVTFDKPYTVTADGVYVGYSFDLTKVDNYPVVVVPTAEDDMFYLHTSRTYRKFLDKTSLGCSSAMQVLVGGIGPDLAAVKGSEIYAQIGTPSTYSFTVYNQGSTAIKSIDYSYELNGKTTTGSYAFSTPIPAHFNASSTGSIDIPALADAGTFTLKFTVTKVNGTANADATPTAESAFNSLVLNPKKRPLLEEYTGTWCGWCPRGFVGLEHMNELLGNDFVGVSYHNGDPMEFTADFPSDVSGFPSAYIDRIYSTDAYCGDNYDGHFNIDDTYAEYGKKFSPVALEGSATLSSDKTAVTVDAKATFAAAQSNGRYQLTYILTADGLKGESSDWNQSNYYPSYATSYPDEDMKQFTTGGSSVSGLTFNFVVVGWSGKSYVAGSLPETVAANEAADANYTLDLTDASLVKSSIIQDYNKLHVVIACIDTTTGEAVNAIKVAVTTPTAIKGVEDNVKSLRTDYYSLDGKRLQKPQKGLNIVRLQNGKVIKAVVK